MSSKFCKFCSAEHPLTAEHWYFRDGGKYQQCKVRTKQKVTEWAANHPDLVREYDVRGRARHKDKDAARRRAWVAANRERVRKYMRAYSTAKRARDPNAKLAHVLRARLLDALHGNAKAGHAVRDLGCTIDELRRHLESKFQPGMTWENHGYYGWHIDHIKPLAAFDLSDRSQFEQAVHFTNLQPLWASDNFSKGKRICGAM